MFCLCAKYSLVSSSSPSVPYADQEEIPVELPTLQTDTPCLPHLECVLHIHALGLIICPLTNKVTLPVANQLLQVTVYKRSHWPIKLLAR